MKLVFPVYQAFNDLTFKYRSSADAEMFFFSMSLSLDVADVG